MMNFQYQDVEEQRRICKLRSSSFVDPEFPAVDHSLTADVSRLSELTIVWKRPPELVANPCLYTSVNGRKIVHQGRLGNCWFVAACTCLTLHHNNFRKVVCCPIFNDWNEYHGIFEFRFWRFGQWITVVVDDLLPTVDGELLYCHSYPINEFWCALLEKAYAKILGSYEALEGGELSDALVDFTGGFTEHIYFNQWCKSSVFRDISSKKVDEVKRKRFQYFLPCRLVLNTVAQPIVRRVDPRNELYNLLLRHLLSSSLIAAAISATNASEQETETPLGLVISHAYAVTRICTFPCVPKAERNNQSVRLVRLINPWGRSKWKGSFARDSMDWMCIEPTYRPHTSCADQNGEFWMSFEDFLTQFKYVVLCHTPIADVWFRFAPSVYTHSCVGLHEPLVPSSSSVSAGPLNTNFSNSNASRDTSPSDLCFFGPAGLWTEHVFHDSWSRGSRGGCLNFPINFDKNPQFAFDIVRQTLCPIAIYLYQKTSRSGTRINTTTGLYHIGMSVFRIEANRTFPITIFDRAQLIANSLYRNSRAVWMRLNLPYGRFVVIPTTYYPDCDAPFMLRFVGPPPISVVKLQSTAPKMAVTDNHSYPQTGQQLDENIQGMKYRLQRVFSSMADDVHRTEHCLDPSKYSVACSFLCVTLIQAVLRPISTGFLALSCSGDLSAEQLDKLTSFAPSFYVRVSSVGGQTLVSSVQQTQILDVSQATGLIRFGESFLLNASEHDQFGQSVRIEVDFRNRLEMKQNIKFAMQKQIGFMETLHKHSVNTYALARIFHLSCLTLKAWDIETGIMSLVRIVLDVRKCRSSSVKEVFLKYTVYDELHSLGTATLNEKHCGTVQHVPLFPHHTQTAMYALCNRAEPDSTHLTKPDELAPSQRKKSHRRRLVVKRRSQLAQHCDNLSSRCCRADFDQSELMLSRGLDENNNRKPTTVWRKMTGKNEAGGFTDLLCNSLSVEDGRCGTLDLKLELFQLAR